jgi:hypothetical protein
MPRTTDENPARQNQRHACAGMFLAPDKMWRAPCSGEFEVDVRRSSSLGRAGCDKGMENLVVQFQKAWEFLLAKMQRAF